MERGRSPKRAHILASINPFHHHSHLENTGERPARRHRLSSPSSRRTEEPDPDSARTRPGSHDAVPQETETGHRRQAAPTGEEHREKETSATPSSPRRTQKTSRFRFKSETHKSRGGSVDDDDDYDPLGGEKRPRRRARTRSRSLECARSASPATGDGRGSSPPRPRHRRHHHHSKHSHHGHRDRSSKRRRPEGEDKERRRRKGHRGEQEEEAEDPYADPPLDADAAFRASLFDAMADDEGAAYWQAVYGQPVHTFGPLDGLTDDEYAAHVRQRMWEKTHEGILEARERRAALERERRDRAAEQRRVDAEVERSLRRGEERRRARARRARWAEYRDAWARRDGGGGDVQGPMLADAEGPMWPVDSGRRRDIGEDAVREFFLCGLDDEEDGDDDGDGGGKRKRDNIAKRAGADGTAKRTETGLAARLKDERVRWHPDKMQQRLGGVVDEAVMRDVTAVFQIVDKLWTDTRSKKS